MHADLGDRSADLLYKFLLGVIPDNHDIAFGLRTIGKFKTPFGFVYFMPLLMMCKSRSLFDQFFHYKHGRFWHLVDYAFDSAIDAISYD